MQLSDLFNPEAQLNTKRMIDTPGDNPLFPSPNTLNTNTVAFPGFPQTYQDRSEQANAYLRSKLNRVQREPDINKLLMFVKMLGGN